MIAPLFIGFEVCFQEIRKKEKLKNKEYNDQFDDDNHPKRFTNGHVFKTLIIEAENIGEKFSHGLDYSGLGVLEPASRTYFQVPSDCFFQTEI
jgi:hypothetical protein